MNKHNMVGSGKIIGKSGVKDKILYIIFVYSLQLKMYP